MHHPHRHRGHGFGPDPEGDQPFFEALDGARRIFRRGGPPAGDGFDGPFGGRGRRGGFSSARKIGSAELQDVLLSLLAVSPRHGYELIRALDERTGGFYVPSPGMVYPALTYLEEIGYATVETEGARKRYHVTPEGLVHLEEQRKNVEAIFAEFDRVRPRMEAFRKAFDGDDDAGRRGSPMHAARHALRDALHEKRRSSPQEQARIAEILERAAAEILTGATSAPRE